MVIQDNLLVNKSNYDRSPGVSFCPRASTKNSKDYAEDRIARIGKAAYYAVVDSRVKNRELPDSSREYYERKRRVKNKINRLKMIKLLAKKELE